MSSNDAEHLLCLKTIVKDDVKLTVSEYRKPCGHRGCLLELFVPNSDESAWLQFAVVGGEDLPNVIDLLEECVPFVFETIGSRRLPTIRLWGKRYVVDERLRELRNVDKPHDRIELRTIA